VPVDNYIICFDYCNLFLACIDKRFEFFIYQKLWLISDTLGNLGRFGQPISNGTYFSVCRHCYLSVVRQLFRLHEGSKQFTDIKKSKTLML
jgi:hypothetical protein